MEKARLIVLTDVGPWTNEPDDAQSLVRLLLYANEYEIEGIIPNASYGFIDTSDEGYMTRILDVVDAYEKVYANLRVHGEGYPTPERVRSIVKHGSYYVNVKKWHNVPPTSREECMQGVQDYLEEKEYNLYPGNETPGSQLVRAAIEKKDTRPLWVALWGGCGTLAQAICDMEKDYTREKMHELLSRLSVYDIDGQDDCGAWIMHRYPEIRWLRSDVAFWGFSETPYKTAGRLFPKDSMIGDPYGTDLEWLREHVLSVGPLGRIYPVATHGLETDSPSLLYVIQNGLNCYEHPEYGGWGGRFTRTRSQNVPAEFFTFTHLLEEKPFYMYRDDVDTYLDDCGRLHRKSMLATVGRWRTAYQNDMAARMQWSVTPQYADANHNPIAVVNGDKTKDSIYIDTLPAHEVTLNASESFDPDGDELSFRWYIYPEAGTYRGEVKIDSANTAHPTLKVPHDAYRDEIHLILEVSEKNRAMPLSAYRRIVIRTGDTGLVDTQQRMYNDTEFTYEGEWKHLTEQYGSHDGDIHISDAVGATARISFYGKRCILFGGAFSDNGIAAMEIDGKPVGECDFYSAFPRWKDRVSIEDRRITTGDTMQYLSPYLGEGWHTLSVTVTGKHNADSTGSNVVIDRLVTFV